MVIGGSLIHLTGAPTSLIARRSGGLFFLTTAVNAASLITAGALLSADGASSHRFVLTWLPALVAVIATAAVMLTAHVVELRPGGSRVLHALAVGVGDAEDSVFRRPTGVHRRFTMSAIAIPRGPSVIRQSCGVGPASRDGSEARSSLRPQDDLASGVALLKLGVGIAHVFQRIGRGDRDLDVSRGDQRCHLRQDIGR